MKKILVLDEESSIRSFIAVNLRRAGYEPVEAINGAQALDILARNRDIPLILMETTLPDMDGCDLCRKLRANDKLLGIIFISAKNREMDKVTGLMSGADDYVTKPFSAFELLARIDALLRRISGQSFDDSEIFLGPFKLDTKKRTLYKNSQHIALTQIEYSIVSLFMHNPTSALSREEILSAVWGKEYFGEAKIVDVNVRRLRMKLEKDPTQPEFITTVWGYGYKWGY